jgi:hypothetical protein
MNFFQRWFWPQSARSEAVSHYKKGLVCSEKNDARGAMDAYTSAIESHDIPDDVKAMALYNRALLLTASGAVDKALADLHFVMNLPAALQTVKLAARRRLERMKNRRNAAAQQAGRASN